MMTDNLLANLLAPTTPQRMSLPQAMNALSRGEIARPSDNELGTMLDEPLTVMPVRRPAPPAPDPLGELKAEWTRQDQIDRQEMLARIYDRRTRAQPTRDSRLAITNAARRYKGAS
jgi:hypothetical protein